MADPALAETLKRLVAGGTLSRRAAAGTLGVVMDGGATPAQVAAFLTALRCRGETENELLGCVEAMRRRAVRVKHDLPIVADTCGTGGDGKGTFNFSTIAALVVAACGVPVAKHGNRAASSKCGSADLLEALGVKVEQPVERLEAALRDLGFAFLYAPALHPAMRHAAPVRRELGFRTIFNLLGPLTNPAFANVQLLGVFDPRYINLVARVLARVGVRRAFVLHGAWGMDELSPCGPAEVADVRGRRVTRTRLGPKDFGLKLVRPRELSGGAPEENARIARDVLGGCEGPYADTTLMNAAAALVAAGRAAGFREGMELGRAALARGDVARLLDRVVEFTRSA